jgi:CBS domain-containing protein
MKVKDIMTESVVYAEVPGSASEALETILKKNLSGMPVVKRGTKKLLGIVTRDDFSRHPEETQLALLMTRDVVTVTPEDDIKDAARIFTQKGFRRLPVVKNGELIGIISVIDIVGRAIAKMTIKETIDKYLESGITVIWEETPIKVAYELMKLSGSHAVPVLNSEAKLVGMVADVDILSVAQLKESTKKSEMSGGTEGEKWGWDSKNVIYITTRKLELPNKRVNDVMIKNVITATRGTTIAECARRMAKYRVEQLPVINAEGDITGIIRDVSLLRTLL